MKAVVFDFNGTLFNDTDFHIEAWQKYMLKKFGIELTFEQTKAGFIGANNQTILRNYFGDGVYTVEELEAFGVEKEAQYREVVCSYPEKMHLMDGAPELFDYLKENNIPFALATASILDNIMFYMNDLGLANWFTLDRIVYDEGKLASKPDPAFYIEAMRRLDVDPADCIIVEDSPAGIEAAVSAKAGRVIAIDRTAPRDWLESNENIHALIHDFHSFEKFL